jgi:hypothetical protein
MMMESDPGDPIPGHGNGSNRANHPPEAPSYGKPAALRPESGVSRQRAWRFDDNRLTRS